MKKSKILDFISTQLLRLVVGMFLGLVVFVFFWMLSLIVNFFFTKPSTATILVLAAICCWYVGYVIEGGL